VSDEADHADALIEAAVVDAIDRARRARKAARATGRCLWCREKTGQGRRWCGPDCRDDWERAHAAACRR
jgi:hypothetical protein